MILKIRSEKIPTFLFILGPLLAGVILLTSLPLTPEQHRLLAIMIWVISSWLNPKIPMAVTGLIGVSLTVLFGISPLAQALKGYANPVIFLFLGGFLLAQGIITQGLDRWIARKSLNSSWVRGNPIRVLMIVTVLAAFFSMFISNTATTAMFIPIALSVFTQLDVHEDHPSFKLLLMVGYAATIGGIGTPIGSPPNVIGISLLESMAAIKITFFDWLIRMLPLMFFTLGGLFLLFGRELKSLPQVLIHQDSVSAPTKDQKKLLMVLGVTIALWILPGLLPLILGHDHNLVILLQARLPEALVATVMSSLLFFIPSQEGSTLLTWKEARHIDWGTLLLFGSGISLGQMMYETGLAEALGKHLPFHSMPYPLALLLLTTITLFSTELMSNTAAANILIPLVISTAPFSENPLVPVLCITLASNMAFMLPVGTPPNAIIYGCGKVKLNWMIKKGFWLNILCLLLIWVMGLLFF